MTTIMRPRGFFAVAEKVNDSLSNLCAATTAAESWDLVYIVTGACGSVLWPA